MNLERLQREEFVKGDSAEETALLREMAIEAKEFLHSFNWCPPIKEIFLGYGVGNKIAAFLVQFTEKIKEKDEFLWVVVGDLPSIYLVTEHAPTAADAISLYCEIASDWATAVLQKSDLRKVFPVRAEPTPANALALQRRIDFLRKTIIPLARDPDGNQ